MIEQPALEAPSITASELAPPGPDDLLVVVGPTASGKTDLAIALCERFDGEIIGADSVQIYRRFDVGSGKPSAEERRRARHHLVDCADARDPLDAARFARMADEAIADVRSRGKTPIVCGGAFLWVKALVQGLSEAAPASPEVRERHRQTASREGPAALHAALATVDPRAAARLHPHDVLRVSRALEVFELTGERQSDLHDRHAFSSHRYPFRLVGVRRSRDELHARVVARIRAWLDAGWVDEVRALVADGLGATRPMGSVGYRQVLDHVEGRLPADDLEVAIDRATRVFVRRQLTWLRDEPITWLRRSA